MKTFLFIFWAIGMWIIASCEKTPEEKRQAIHRNTIENEINMAELKADSLRKA